MKKFAALFAAVALLALGTAAFAADTATVNVSATVLGSCQFSPATPTVTLAFPATIVVPAAANVPATPTAVGVICSTGIPWTITSVSANGGFLHDAVSGGNIGYSYALGLASGTGTGAAQNVAITGSIPMGNLGAAVAAGTYTDVVTLTLNP